MNSFTDWLKNELKERGWNYADLARQANLSKSSISMVMTGLRRPGPGFSQAVARAFGLPVDIVYQHSGLLSSNKEPNSLFMEEVNYLISQLSEEKQLEAIEIIKALLRIENDQKATHHSSRMEKP